MKLNLCNMEEIKIGKYKHFKGGEYKVLGIALHSETQDELVVYQSLKDGGMWACPKKMFADIVDKPDLGYKGPRFIFISE